MVSEVSRFSCMKFLGVPWGLRPRRTDQNLALSLLSMLPSAHVNRVGVRVVSFRGSMATPPILYLRFAGSLAVAAQDSRPSGSLVLSRKNFAFSASYRLSGRAMARTGLRMMPTFPSSPLKFRTAGFPQYGFKVGLSKSAFPARGAQLSRPSDLHPSFVPAAFKPVHPRTVSGQLCAWPPPFEQTCCSTPGALAPVRVMLSRSILTYSAPSAPLAGTSRLRRLAAYTRCHCWAHSHRA